MACTNVDGNFYALQGTCPRCGFDLFKGTMIVDDPGWDSLPRVACPTCSTTYGWRDGKHGPPLKQKGLSAFVGSLAKTATTMDAYKNAKAYRITRDQDGRVFCKEAPQN
jgi:nitrite reductase/ring-hydroxylating ferredoxin subunit